jgi:CRP-like cAMP-binding protein
MDVKRNNILKNISFFKNFSDKTIGVLNEKSQIIDLEKGGMLFSNKDKADRFYLVTKGWVKLYRETIDGVQSIVDILTTNSVFGETSLFENDAYPFSAEATETAQVISFPLPVLKKEIENNSELSMDMMRSMVRHKKQQDQEIENRTLQNASQRIGCFLLRLVDQEQESEFVIQLPYDKTLVAARLGMQPETFSRALNKLKDQININVVGREIYISNLQDLTKYACSACSSEFPCRDMKS